VGGSAAYECSVRDVFGEALEHIYEYIAVKVSICIYMYVCMYREGGGGGGGDAGLSQRVDPIPLRYLTSPPPLSIHQVVCGELREQLLLSPRALPPVSIATPFPPVSPLWYLTSPPPRPLHDIVINNNVWYIFQ